MGQTGLNSTEFGHKGFMQTGWKRWVIGELSWRRLAASCAFLYASLAAYAHFGAEAQIFLPPEATYGPAKERSSLASDSERLAALYMHRPGARCTLLMSHGNAEDLGTIRPLLEACREMGFSVFAYDYRGYGLSSGRPSEAGAYRDVLAAYRHVTEALGVPADRVVAYGRSVGSGPAVELASRVPVAGLVLECPFTSAFRVRTGVAIFPFDKFDNLAKMPRVSCPVLVMHGASDDMIPVAHGEALFAAAPGAKQAWWPADAGHTDLWEADPVGYGKTLQAFARTMAGAQR